MRAFAAALLSLAVATAAHAQDAEDSTAAVLQTLRTVCLPASERNIAPRNLALPAGFTFESKPPPAVRQLFPATALGSLSLVKKIQGGTLHVTSTVLLPPATPFSCLITSDVDAPGLIEALSSSNGYGSRYKVIPSSNSADTEGLHLSAASKGAVDAIMAARKLGQPPGYLRVLVLAYRVDTESAVAARDIQKHCLAGTMPHPELLCSANGGR